MCKSILATPSSRKVRSAKCACSVLDANNVLFLVAEMRKFMAVYGVLWSFMARIGINIWKKPPNSWTAKTIQKQKYELAQHKCLIKMKQKLLKAVNSLWIIDRLLENPYYSKVDGPGVLKPLEVTKPVVQSSQSSAASPQ